ncbi:sterol homeostasis protein [Varicellaria rhodocarpa]|nr:sterol homeostasis protein [Varicellaria rhodocarpa]
MPICIECRYPVSQLYHVLHSTKKPNNPTPPSNLNGKPPTTTSSPNSTGPSKEKSKGRKESKGGIGGGDVRLTQCPRCKRFADKYVEHDFVVLFIDLVLVKPQVYRHLLFNRLAHEDDELDPSITRLGTLLLLFDVYLTWSHIESLPSQTAPSFVVPRLHILLQYAFYLLYCTLTTLALHLTIRGLAGWIVPSNEPENETTRGQNETENPKAAAAPSSRPNAISTALFVSSCMKLFPILMVVWKYDDEGGQVGKGVEWAVAVQNLEALRILLGCSYFVAGVLVGAGALARLVVGKIIFEVVGLRDVGGGLSGL